MLILTEICQELRNWFDRYEDKFIGEFFIVNGEIHGDIEFKLKPNQYYRIIGSTFNDGVHKYARNVDGDELVDEDFTGVVWAMAVPPSVIALADDIDQWNKLYGAADSVNMSPYSSESFGGYSYTKSGSGSGSAGVGSTGAGTWRDVFKDRLNRWRKI